MKLFLFTASQPAPGDVPRLEAGHRGGVSCGIVAAPDTATARKLWRRQTRPDDAYSFMEEIGETEQGQGFVLLVEDPFLPDPDWED